MISFKIQVQGSDVMIHLPNDNTTTNYHVTKHTILGYDDEGFKHYIGINKKEISKIREKQISDYNCKVSHIVAQKNSCNNCVKVFECKTSISENVRPCQAAVLGCFAISITLTVGVGVVTLNGT